MKRRTKAALIDALESRRMLATVVNGSDADDSFLISVGGGNTISLTLNGVPQSVSTPGDGIVEVHGLGGNDDIALLNTGTLNFFLFGELGDDDFTVGNGNLLNNILEDVQIIEPSGAGNDTCTINDLNGAGLSWSADGSSFSFLSISSPFISLPAMVDAGDSTLVRCSNNNDTLRLSGGGIAGAFPAKTYFDLGGGSDTVHLGGSQAIVEPNLPASSTIDAGTTGTDSLTVDDSNTNSTRSGIDFDDNGLVGGPQLKNFSSMTVTTHLLPGGLPEPVTFRGFNAPVPQINIAGTSGEDLVQFGTPANPITSQNYWGLVNLNLGAGVNNVEVNQSGASSGASWTFNQGGLSVSTGPASLVTFSTITFTLRSTDSADLFTVNDTPDTWRVFVDGKGGNDRLQMGTSLDLDNAFDSSSFYFMGGDGTDTIEASDANDQIGDIDDYTIGTTVGFAGGLPISDGSIEKGDFTAPQSMVMAYHGVEKLVLVMDNDSNRLFYDFGGLTTVEVFGSSGSDIFTNRAVGGSNPDRLSTSLAQSITFHGDAGTDDLVLKDGNGGPGDYEITTSQFFYLPGSTLATLNFDGFSNFQLTGSPDANEVFFRSKPSGAAVTLSSGDGDDTFHVGGGDLDSNGFFSGGFLLSAGNGHDEIVFDDHLDVSGGGETEAYTFGNLSLSKGALTLLYSTFESQTLEASDNGPLINLFSISGFLDSTTINGGPTPGSLVHVGQTNLGNISGVVNLNNVSIVRIHDESFAGTSTFEITGTQVRKTTSNQTINYTNVGSIELNTGTLGDTIIVRGLAAGSQLTINGNAGNDAFTLGNGNIDLQILGAVSFFGGTGINVATVDNTSDPTLESQTISSDIFFRLFTDGQTHSFNSVSSLDVIGGPGGTNFNILSTKASTRVVGLSGNDTFTVGGGNIDANFPTGTSGAPSVFVDGGSGTDSLVINDLNDTTTTDSYTFQRPSGVDQLDKADSGNHRFITFAGMESATLDASSAPNTFLAPTNILVTNLVTPLRINGNGGSDSVSVGDAVSPVFVNTGLGSADHLVVNSDSGAGDAPVTVVVDQSDDIENLIVNSGGTLRVADGATLVKSRDISPTGFLSLGGVLDLAGGSFVSRAGGPISLATFRTMITAGRNGGAWNGTSAGAINSSTAAGSSLLDSVGYGLGSEVAPTNIGGFTIAPGDTVLRYTLDGDANLDKSVNSSDFNLLASNFGLTNRHWAQADFTYEGSANSADFNSLAGNFGGTATGSSGSTGSFGRNGNDDDDDDLKL